MNFSINQTKIVVTFVTGILHEYRQYQPVLCTVLPVRYTQMQVSWYVTLYTAVFGTVWPLLGSRWNGQGMLYLFQKRLPCCSTLSIAVMLRHYLFAPIYCVVC